MNYSQTLNLPVFEFHICSESEIINFWKKNKINSQLKQKNRTSKERCIILGKPIKADSLEWNSLRIQVHKDILLKYKNMAGFDVHWITMWDLYNPSIKQIALQELELENRKDDILRLRRCCRNNLEEYIGVRMELLRELGVFYDWQSIKKMMNPRYDARIVRAFGKLVENGYLRKDIKPSYWCIKCQKILTDEDDIVNKTYQAYSGYVKFPVSIGLEEYGESVYMLVWVDTLWMLAASVAIVIREGGIYSILKSGSETLIVEKGKEKLITEKQNKSNDEIKVLDYISHSELAKCKCIHPFLEYDLPVVSSKYIKDRVGIGLYNVAPGHNPIDYELALKHRFKTFSVVDAEGRLTNKTDKFCGLKFLEAGKFIAFELEKRGYLIKMVTESSEYPHCSSCDIPAIFRPVSQWLLSPENNKLSFHTFKEFEDIDWKCDYQIEEVMANLQKTNKLYISCQREWGMPIPVINCNKCGQVIINKEVMKSIKEIVYRRSPDSWFRLKVEDLLPSDIQCPSCGSQEFIKEQGVLKPDFFSAMNTITRIPANLSTNTTGIFYANRRYPYSKYLTLFFLATSALKSSIPFDEFNILFLDEHPEDYLMLNTFFDSDSQLRYTSDFIRLCTIASTEKGECLSVESHQQNEIKNRIDKLKEEYELVVKRLYLTVGNLVDYESDIDYSSLVNLDKLALVRLDHLIKDVIEEYTDSNFYSVWYLISKYIQEDLGFYLDAISDRIYASAKSSKERISAQTALYEIVSSLAKLIAPIFPFLAEQLWYILNSKRTQNINDTNGYYKKYNMEDRELKSIFLTELPKNKQRFEIPTDINDWTELITLKEQIIDEVDSALEKGIIDSKEQAVVTIPESILRQSEEISDTSEVKIESYLKDLEIACSVAEIKIEDCERYSINRIKNGMQCKRCSRYYKIYNPTERNNYQKELCNRCAEIIEVIL